MKSILELECRKIRKDNAKTDNRKNNGGRIDLPKKISNFALYRNAEKSNNIKGELRCH